MCAKRPESLVLNKIHKFWIAHDLHKLKLVIYFELNFRQIKITQWFKQISVTEIDMGSNLPKVSIVSVGYFPKSIFPSDNFPNCNF